MPEDYRHSHVTGTIIGAAYRVHNALGAGFLEKVYENALAVEVRKSGLVVEQQVPISVRYEGTVVGEYVADLAVGGKVIVEIKAISALDACHEAQLINYLKATGLEVGLLLNFGAKVEVKRRIMDGLSRCR